jgi:short-subunit dehydrogenase
MAGIELRGSRVLLTGASSGIGRELARELAGRGALLAISARRGPLLRSLADELQARGHERPAVLEADLSRRGAAEELAAAARSELGGVDVLVNNAGGGVGGGVASVGDRDEAREAFEVNFWAPLALTRALLPGMRERGRGAVVNVTSGSRAMTWPGFGMYASTKAALGLATETLQLELLSSPVHVLEAVPGPVDTAVQGETRLIPGIGRMIDRVPLGDAAVMARRIARALERGAARVVYPRTAALPLVLPGVVRRYARRQVARTLREVDAETFESLMSLVVRTGSGGDEVARQARDAWERQHGR